MPVGMQTMGGTIPLSMLMDFIVQRTYHELTVLSELLQRKTDMERKIEIVQFASRTRQLFVRLLALVKWMNSASKVNKCGRILSFLHQQEMLLIDTADNLARMARETLVHARLPSFSLPCAVDVLTTGTYSRLPSCIRDRIIPPGPITPLEKKQTLQRLSQIIEHRIVTTDLPRHMCKPLIGNGRVKFRVEHEFEVTLTLMGDGPTIPWRLLDINFLVEDPEVGDGQALVHSLQVNYIHQLVQSRLIDNEQPLDDLHACLHSFCQSLQLEVLHSQTLSLMRHRLGDSIHIEEYTVGKCLLLSYWRDSGKKDSKPFQQVYKLNVHVNEADKNKPLQISHFPQILGSESTKVAHTITSDHLSIEKLLVHTVHIRSLTKLKDLDRELRLILSAPCEIRDVPLILYVSLLNPCLDSEKLCIAVDLMKGTFLVSLAQKATALTSEIEECLNADKRDLRKLLHSLKCWLMLERCRKSLQYHQVACYNSLPLTNLSGHALESLSKHRLYARLPKQTEHYLVVEIHDVTPLRKRKIVEYRYHLLQVKADDGSDFTGSTNINLDSVTDQSVAFLRAGHLVEIDSFLATHGPCGRLFDSGTDDRDYLSRKRKLLLGDKSEPPAKKQAYSSVWFVPELMHIIAMCEERLPLVELGEELDRRNIAHQGIQVEGEGVAMSLALLQAPPSPSGMDPDSVTQLRKSLMSFLFRLQSRSVRTWVVEAVFARPPIESSNVHECGPYQRILLMKDKLTMSTMEKIVDMFLVDEWSSVARLYDSVLQFAAVYKEDQELSREVEVKSYNFRQFVLAYGPAKCYTVTISYSGQFHVTFGTSGQASAANCHTPAATYLEKDLNQTGSLVHLAKTLSESWPLWFSVGKLAMNPTSYIKKQTVMSTFSIVPQSSTHIRIIYRNCYCLDLQCRLGRFVSVRDGAYSTFETNKVVECLNPIPNLQAFLNMFVDEAVLSSHARRRSTAEDDNPPSPVGMDTVDGLMSQPVSSVGSATSRRDMMVTPSPSSVLVPSPSNVALHVPSPSPFAPAPSPGTLGVHMPSPASFISPQAMVDGSPYQNPNLIVPSPGQRNWPPSPSMPGPSPSSRVGTALSPSHSRDAEHRSAAALPARMLPQRSWAASVPTLLSQDAIARLLTPTTIGLGSGQCCPLERFLASVFLRRHLQRIMQDPANVSYLQQSEPGVVMFKLDCGLQFRVSINPATMQSLHLKVASLQTTDYASAGQCQWDSEELMLIERFFEAKVSCFPYKSNTLMAFIQLVKAPWRILKDFIQIMKMELMPDRSLRWSLQWCLTVPLSLNNDSLIGQSAVVIQSTKIVFMIQLIRNAPPGANMPGQSVEPQTFVVPIIYNINGNMTSMMFDHKSSPLPPSPPAMAVNNLLKRFHDFNKLSDQCSIFPAVRELLMNLTL